MSNLKLMRELHENAETVQNQSSCSYAHIPHRWQLGGRELFEFGNSQYSLGEPSEFASPHDAAWRPVALRHMLQMRRPEQR